MNEVTVTVLPHPVTMFFLGSMLLGLLILFFAYLKTMHEIKTFKSEVGITKQEIETTKNELNKSVSEISRKVDSRIDKALGNLKKQ